MIVVKVWGGLGNQLFQFAFGYMMAKEHQDELQFDISFYKKHQYKYVGHRDYELSKLSCKAPLAEYVPHTIVFLESFLINRLLRRVKGKLSFSIGNVYFIKEPKHRYITDIPYKAGKINYYDGYWQSGMYFKEYYQELAELFQPAFDISEEVKQFMKLIDEEEESVSVHVRKGDFHGKIGHEVEKEYYQKAIQYINHVMNHPKFFVFSDDIAWTRENIDFGEQAIFAEYRCENGAICDLMCMAKCKHGIMSASTFSWWGNWRKEGIVIAPTGEYFNNKFLNDGCIRL